MHDVTMLDCSRIAQDLQIRKVQVESVVQLLDEGNTVPFITRYRKERTGVLDVEIIRHIQTRVKLLRQLGDRKQTILKSIEGQGKLTADLRAAILGAESAKRLEDLYLPYKPKKRSLASAAREHGLEPLALAVWYRDAAVANLEEMLPTFVNPDRELPTAAEVRAGVQHILAEMVAETAAVRAGVRAVLWESGKICSSKHDKLADGQGLEYKDYFQFSEPLRQIPAHRILALNRAEKENALKLHLEWDVEGLKNVALRATAEAALKSQADGPAPPRDTSQQPASLVESSTVSSPAEANQGAGPDGSGSAPQPALAGDVPEPPGQTLPGQGASVGPATDTSSQPEQPAPAASATAPMPALPDRCPLPPDVGEPLSAGSALRTPHAEFLKVVVEDALARLLIPSLEREIRHELTDEAEGHAVSVFARNLRSLLLQPPLRARRVLAIDPGFRTGCKVAVLDETSNLLDETVVYPHAKKGPRDRGPKPAAPDKTTVKTEEGAATATPAAATTEAALTVIASAPTPAMPDSPSATPIPEAASSTAPAPASDGIPAPAVTESSSTEANPPQVTASSPETTAAPLPLTEASKPQSPPPPSKRDESKSKIEELIVKHRVNVIAIGNGTGCRETEELIADLIATRLPELAYVIVNEAGASVYSVSPVGREEFPTYDATLRGTISIGRRLQDPLSELVKIDPQNVGVGLYQHDVRRRDLKESLDGVVESCVNQVGVDVNSASVPLLRHVSGMNQMIARELVDHRKQHGAFKNREQLLQLPGMGANRFVQAAGFLKIHAGDNPLDSTWIHPESYGLTHKILSELGYGPDVVADKGRTDEFHDKLKGLAPLDLANRLGAGVPTIADILEALARPGHDPREDLPPPIFKKGILKLEDLQPGMELKGTVLNVVDFGAFVDIGLKDSGLVHISQLANRYIKSPYDVVAVNDVVTVWVLTVDKERHRVSLSMIKPGTERKPGERPPRREQQASRPPRGRRPGPPGNQGPPQGSGQDQGATAPPSRGRPPRHGRPPGRAPAPAQAAGDQPAAASAERTPPPSRQAPPPRPVYPPRKHRRDTPKPKLSQDALEGKVPLRTFSELSALFAAKTREPAPPPPPQPVVAAVEPTAPVQEAGEAPPSGG